MGAAEPAEVCRKSIQSRGTSRTKPTGLASESRSGKGDGIELNFARTGTSRSARGDGRTEPTGAGERTRFGKATVSSSPSLAPEPVDQQEVTVSSSHRVESKPDLEKGGDTELNFARTRNTGRSARGDGLTQPTGLPSEPDMEKTAAIPSSTTLTPEPVDQQEVMASSSPPGLRANAI